MYSFLGPKLNGALQCFSCKSLLDPSKECDEFSNRDPNQVGTCGSNEACLLYAWKKSPTETCKNQYQNLIAKIVEKFIFSKFISEYLLKRPFFTFSAVLRECFPTSVLLGPIDNPLTAELDCNLRDISEPGSSNIKACLCTTPFCNEGSNDPLIQQAAAQEAAKKKDSPPKASSSSSRTTSPPRRSQTTRRPSRTTTRRSQTRNDFRSKPAKSEKRKPVRLQSSSQRLSSSNYLINCFYI